MTTEVLIQRARAVTNHLSTPTRQQAYSAELTDSYSLETPVGPTASPLVSAPHAQTLILSKDDSLEMRLFFAILEICHSLTLIDVAKHLLDHIYHHV
jgi:hypothetical protein